MGSASTDIPRIAVTSVRIEQDKLDAFKELAASERRSVSQHLRYLIDQALAAAGADAA